MLSFSALAENNQTTGHYQQHNEDVDQLEKLLEISEVKKIQEQCERDNSSNISDCIWQGVQADEKVLESVQAKMNETLNNSENDIKQYESVTAISTKKEKSKSMQALEKFYADKISKELFGEPASVTGKVKIIDHSNFNKIYESQLTKNILSAVSSFCIEAEMINGFPLIDKSASKRKSRRKKNVLTLSETGVTQKVNEDGSTTDISSAESASSDWQMCMDNAQYVCHDGVKHITRSDGTVSKVTAKDKLDIDCSSDKSSDKKKCENYKYTQGRACELTNYLKVAKQNLKAVEKIEEGYKQLASGSSYGIQGTNAKNEVVTEDIVINKKKLENMTSTSSNEFSNESGFAEETSADLAEFERCFAKDDNAEGGYKFVEGAKESCKKYLNTDHSSRDQIMNEHMLRQRTLSEKVKKLNETGENTEDLAQFLKDQGRSDEEIANELKDVDIVALKNQISQRYENEKEALIQSMNEKLEATSSDKDGMIDITQGSNDYTKLKKIHDELSAKTENYTQLIHYNNIVTGFLEIKDQDGNSKGRNTASIQKELENSAYVEGNMEALGIDKNVYENQLEGLGQAIETSNISLSDGEGDSNEETSSTIGVDRLNQDILNYDTEPQTP